MTVRTTAFRAWLRAVLAEAETNATNAQSNPPAGGRAGATRADDTGRVAD